MKIRKKICIFGDSITRGNTDREEGGWVNRLRKYIENKDSEARVYNMGVSGDTTDGLLKRFDVEAGAREPEIIIFAIGVNDSAYLKPQKSNWVSLDKFKKNLGSLKKKASVFTKQVIFVGITPVDEKRVTPIPWNTDYIAYRNKDIEKYDEAIKNLCEKNNLPFIPMYDLLNKEDLDDGLHPNAAGHEKMFQRVKGFLIENKII